MLQLLGTLFCLGYLLRILSAIPGVTSRKRSLKDTLGRSVLITGATDGIGKAFARRVVKEGLTRITISGRDKEKLNALKDELVQLASTQDSKPIIDVIQYDFSNNLDYIELEQKIQDCNPDSLINCAGISYPSALYYHELPIEFIDRLINVNVMTPLVVCSAVMRSKSLRKSNKGTLVLLGSASSVVAEPLLVGYSATKAALEGFCDSINSEQLAGTIGIQNQVPLMVTSKMSKIRNPSLFVPTAERYVKDALAAARYASNLTINNHMTSTVSPYLAHYLLLLVVQLTPQFIFERFRLSQQKVIRQKYLKKTEGQILC